METFLLESGTRRRRFDAATLPSVAIHAILIAGAIHLTAHAALSRQRPHPEVITVSAPVVEHGSPLRRPPQPLPGGRSSDGTTHEMAPVQFSIPALPSYTSGLVGPVTPDPGRDLIGHGLGSAVVTSGSATSGVLEADAGDRTAQPLSGNAAPDYPATLRASGVEGTVVARFVVDTGGRVETGSITIVRADDERFVDAVRRALQRARFRAAELAGVPVRQLVEQPFSFVLH